MEATVDDALIVEVLDTRGRVEARCRLSALPATIGRGYENAVILDDPYVSPQHARLERRPDGAVVLIDLNSTNGVSTPIAHQRRTEIAIGDEAVVRIGQSTLRLRPARFDVGPALVELREPGRLERVRMSWWGWLAPAVVVIGWTELSNFLDSYEKPTALQFILPVLFLFVFATAWVGFWSLVSRISLNKMHIGGHLFVLSMAACVSAVMDLVGEYAAFAFDAPRFAEGMDWIASGLVLCGLLLAHLRLSSDAPRRRLLWRSIAITAVVLAGTAALTIGRNSVSARRGTLDFDNRLWPPMFRVSGGTSLDEFMRGAAELKARVDTLATKDGS